MGRGGIENFVGLGQNRALNLDSGKSVGSTTALHYLHWFAAATEFFRVVPIPTYSWSLRMAGAEVMVAKQQSVWFEAVGLLMAVEEKYWTLVF